MPKTRAAHRRSSSARRSRNRSYARRRASSPCRGKGPAVCRSKSGCKYTKGKKRSFSRKSKNTRRTRGGSACGKHGGGTHRRTRSAGAGGVIANALVPFGLWGAKSAYGRRK